VVVYVVSCEAYRRGVGTAPARRTAAFGAAVVLAAASLVLSGCSSSPTSSTSPTPTTSATETPTSASPEPSSASPTPSPSSASPTPSPTLSGAATAAVSASPSSTSIGLLRAVRLAGQPGYDRFVLEFTRTVPGFDIRYVDGPVRQDPSDDVLTLAGTHFLLIRLEPASSIDQETDPITDTYTGPDRVTGTTAVVREAVLAGDFEAVMSWALGIDGERPFTVSRLASPPRLVVDVATS
jgi:hypothetical protein